MAETHVGKRGLRLLSIDRGGVREMAETQVRSDRGVRLLSIDGGGIKGMSVLYILQNLMWRIKMADDLDHIPRPCEYFDMIGGTNTGGLIALMLGRLRMSIEEAIACWGQFSVKVFGDTKRFGGHDSKYKASNFEDVLKSIVNDHTEPHNPETGMMEMDAAAACKTFVCAMNADNMNASIPVLFRTYVCRKEVPIACKIWEAARATCAMPILFKRIEIGSSYPKLSYIDGGMGRNNPAKIVQEEARFIFPDRDIMCLISIGTGYPKTIALAAATLQQSSSVDSVDKLLMGIATDCERTAQHLSQEYSHTPDVYFRFNVQRGMEQIMPEQWERLTEVRAHTEQYLKDADVAPKVDQAITVLRKGHTTVVANASRNEQVLVES